MFLLSFAHRSRTLHPRGPLAPRQKGCRRPKAPRDQPQGQGLEVPPHSHRVPYPPSRPVLQDEAADPTFVQVRLGHRLHPHRIDVFVLLRFGFCRILGAEDSWRWAVRCGCELEEGENLFLTCCSCLFSSVYAYAFLVVFHASPSHTWQVFASNIARDQRLLAITQDIL